MDLKGLVLATDYFLLDETSEAMEGQESGVDFKFDIGVIDGLVTSKIEIAYCKSKNLDKPLAKLGTTLKFWIGPDSFNVESSERVLYSVKTQHSYMYFLLYQKLISLSIENLYLQPPPDSAFYTIIRQDIELVDLQFNELENYCFPF